MKNTTTLPLLRTQNTVVKELPNEILIYDLDKNRAFCLNETARFVMDECDGKTTVDEAIVNLNKKFNSKISEEMVWMVVDQLQKADFIEKDYEIPIPITRVSRRKILHSAAALGISLPMITSLVAPMAVNAQSGCVAIEGTCNFEPADPCCPGSACSESEIGNFCVGCIEIGQPCAGEGSVCCGGGFCVNVEAGPTGFQCVLPR